MSLLSATRPWLPSASPPFDQIILHADRGTCVWTTWQSLRVMQWPRAKPTIFWLQVWCPVYYTTMPHDTLLDSIIKCLIKNFKLHTYITHISGSKRYDNCISKVHTSTHICMKSTNFVKAFSRFSIERCRKKSRVRDDPMSFVPPMYTNIINTFMLFFLNFVLLFNFHT